MIDSLKTLRENLALGGGRIWLLKAQARRNVLNYLTVFGSSVLADLLPNGLSRSGIVHSNDIVDWYVRWVGTHIECGEYPSFDLSDDAMCEDGPRVLLVSPMYKLNVVSIGLIRIAFFLRGLGIHADWVVATNNNIDFILKKAYHGGYHVIGHGTTHYTFVEDMRLLIRMADVSPKSIFLLGGHGAVFESTMLKRVLTETPVSYIVRGFGERSTARLVIAQEQAEIVHALQPSSIPGIHLLQEGEVLSTGIDSYNELEFRSVNAIFDGRLYPVEDGLTRLITSTHCSFKCSFCSSRNFPEQSTTRLDPLDVIHIIENLKQHHPELHYIEFNDDNFSTGYRQNGQFRHGTDWLQGLCYAANGGAFDGLKTYCYSRADTIDNNTLVSLVKNINLSKIGIGLEHVNHAILKAMKKGNDTYCVIDRIRQALKLGIDTNFFVILFSKWETRATIIEIIDASIRLVLEGAQVVYNWGLQPLCGADISKDPSNLYLSSYEKLGSIQFEHRSKIVPDDPEIAIWFRRMNADFDMYFALQDELIAQAVNLGRASSLDIQSPWIKRIFRQHRNINLSNTLTNLVRFHSMFEFGRRFLDPEDPYFIEGTRRTWDGVLAYVFNGPTYAHDSSATSIQRKIEFLSREIGNNYELNGTDKLFVELDVIRVGMRAPNHSQLKPNSLDHKEWARKAMPRWEELINDIDTSTENGSYAVAALYEIIGLLNGRHQ